MVQRRATHRRKKKTEIDPRLIIVGSVVLIVLAIGLMIVTRKDTATTAAQTTNTASVKTVPDFTLTGLENTGPISLSDYRGHFVLLNFWATWCPPCQAELPELQAYYTDYRSKGFVLLGVDVAEDPATVSTFLQQRGFDFPVGVDVTGAVHASFGTNSLPLSVLVGPNGELIKMWRPGAITRSMLEQDVTPLLGG
jgi:thiol-disulfide isomerase/thioredoxin